MKNLKAKASVVLLSVAITACSKPDFKFTGVEGTLYVPMGDRLTESFTQNKSQGEVDILIVSDNSASMAAQQLKLGERFAQFTQAFDQIDYQIGVITTDVESTTEQSRGTLVRIPGQQGRVLKGKGNNNSHNTFLDMVRVGTSGSGNEQAMLASMMAFEKRNAENNGFFRDSTDVALLILSDEDEMSTGTGTKAEEVVQQFNSIWGDSKRLMAFGIIVKPGDTACYEQQIAEGSSNGAYYGTRVQELSDLTGGATFSICDSDYSESLKAISEKVRNLVFSIQLSQFPVPQTVQVEFSTGEKIPFRVVGDRVIFDRTPKQGTQIIITYNRTK